MRAFLNRKCYSNKILLEPSEEAWCHTGIITPLMLNVQQGYVPLIFAGQLPAMLFPLFVKSNT